MILVTGATGYVGGHVVHRLRAAGRKVRCVVRPSALDRQLEDLRALGCEVVRASLSDARALLAAVEGVDGAIHMAGSIRPAPGETPHQIHVEATGTLVQALRAAPIRKLVLLSSLGVRPKAVTGYHRTKWEAESIVRESGMAYVILRPSLIFGRLVGHRDSKLMARLTQRILEESPVPVISGAGQIQPIFIGDVAQCLVAALERDDLFNETLELGGPTAMDFESLVDTLAKSLRRQPKKRRLPYGLALGAGMLLERVVSVPAVTSTEVRSLREGSVCRESSTQSVFGIEPLSLEAGLALGAGTLVSAR